MATRSYQKVPGAYLQGVEGAEVVGGLKGEGLNPSSPSLYPSAGGVTLIFLLGAYIHQLVSSVMS